MKKYLIFMLSAAFIFSLTLSAQDKTKSSVTVIEKRAEKMATELGLNDVEKAKVKVLLEKQSNDYNKAKSELSPQSADFKTQLEKLHKAQEEELKKVIGNEKFAKLKENRAAEKAKIEAAKAKM